MKNKKNLKQLFQISAFLLCLGLFFNNNVLFAKCNEVVNSTETVEDGGAETVQALIELQVGELSISGGADVLMEGNFDSNLDNPEPHVNYFVNGVAGVLTVEQHAFSSGFIAFRKRCRKPITEWNIGLNNNVPIDLNINTGTGSLDLDPEGVEPFKT